LAPDMLASQSTL